MTRETSSTFGAVKVRASRDKNKEFHASLREKGWENSLISIGTSFEFYLHNFCLLAERRPFSGIRYST